MIAGLVCARAGSEGLPGKNLLQLGGVSLIDVAIEKAMASEYIDAVVVARAAPNSPVAVPASGRYSVRAYARSRSSLARIHVSRKTAS
jgi:N-acylneuraminate cytidylyltransferase